MRHPALLPIFGTDYKVRGMVGLLPLAPPLWYPGSPVAVTSERLVFKDTDYAEPLPIAELLALEGEQAQDEAERWKDALVFDPTRRIERWLRHSAAGRQDSMLPAPRNIAGQLLLGQPVLDVVYEPSLHRVRGFWVRRNWYSRHELSALGIPALRESLGSGHDSTIPNSTEGHADNPVDYAEGNPDTWPTAQTTLAVGGGGLLGRLLRHLATSLRPARPDDI